MITLVTGAPGSGKSYYAVRQIARSVYKGRPVVTNVPLVDDWAEQLARGWWGRSQQKRQDRAAHYRRLVFISDDLDQLLRVRLVGEGEGRGDMIIDEFQRWADSRTWDTQIGQSRDEAIASRQELNYFFQKHRHLGYEVWLITQHEANIDKRVSRLFEYLVELKNLKRVRVFGIPIFPINLFVAPKVWNDRIHSKCSMDVYGLDKKIARLYGTHALAGVDERPDTILHPQPVLVS